MKTLEHPHISDTISTDIINTTTKNITTTNNGHELKDVINCSSSSIDNTSTASASSTQPQLIIYSIAIPSIKAKRQFNNHNVLNDNRYVVDEKKKIFQ